MSKFISDEEMTKLESSEPKKSTFISDEEMSNLESENDVSILESLARSGWQGATVGFADEIGAGALALTTDPTLPNYFERLKMNYEMAKDEIRGANKASEEANPGTYMAGDVAGGIVAGLATGGVGSVANLGKVGVQQGVKALSKQALKTGLQGAAFGSAAGLGYSDADLTKGEIEQAATDTAVGGLVGGAGSVLLPTAFKTAGKVTNVTKELVSDLPLAKDFVKAFNTRKQGIPVVGSKAQELIAQDVENISKELVKGTTEQIKQSSKNMGEILKSVKNTEDLPKLIGDFEKQLDVGEYLPDDKAKLQNLLDQLKEKVTKETIEPGKDIAKRNLEKKMRIEEATAPMFGESVSFPNVKETPDALIALRKKLNKEGLEEVSALTENIPEDKITKETISKVKDLNLENLYDLKKRFRDLKESGKVEFSANDTLKTFMKEIDNTIEQKAGKESFSDFLTNKQKMKDAFQAGKIISGLDENSKLGPDVDLNLQKFLINAGDDLKKRPDLKRAFGYLDDNFVNPETKQKAFDITDRVIMNKQADQLGLLSPLSTVRGTAIRTGAAVGRAAGSKITSSTADFTRKLLGTPDPILNKIGQTIDPIFRTTLQKAVQDTTKKDRILWSLSQQPAFREAVQKYYDNEENAVELQPLDVNIDN